MSLLGEFARIPEVLVHKRGQPRSLKRTWEFNQRQWFEVTASCMRELWSADISTEDKIAISHPFRSRLLLMQAKMDLIQVPRLIAQRMYLRLYLWLSSFK
jgi:hypothetical protein